MKEEIISQLNILIGLKSGSAGRAANLFWIGFGDLISITRKGETLETEEYALHIQCSWRITLGNKIVVASKDLYVPNSTWDGEDEDFNWDVQGNNRFDDRINNFMNDKDLIVLKIDSDDIGGLKIHLSEGYTLDVFPDGSEDDEYSEHWRFFNRKGDTPHFIVSGSGIEKV
jgi:hypothetical protein